MQQLPLFLPKSNWVAKPLPGWLVDTDTDISLDTETYDPNLKNKGPGFCRRDGFVCGISLATAEEQWYLPIRHFEYGGRNFDRRAVTNFLSRLLANPRRTCGVANGGYDIGWLSTEGVLPSCKWFDVQIAESLLEEEHPNGNSLEQLGRRYPDLYVGGHSGSSPTSSSTITGKDEQLLKLSCGEFLGSDRSYKSQMHNLPPQMVGPYAEWDARRTYDVWHSQLPRIQKEGLNKICALEMRLLPWLVKVTLRGVRIDTPLAEKLNRAWQFQETAMLKQMGITLEQANSTAEMSKLLRTRGIDIPLTEKGNNSVTNAFLLGLGNPFASTLGAFRELHHLRKEFIQDKLLGMLCPDGRLHPNYVQIAMAGEGDDDEAGTRTGRMSSRNPNEQQIPKRSKLLVDTTTYMLTTDVNKGISIGKIIRATRIPEDGCRWFKFDFNSQEPRWQCHYGLLCKYPGATEARDAFIRGEKIYNYVGKEAGLPYDLAKMGFLAPAYGQSANGFAKKTGKTKEEAQDILDKINAKFPYVKMLADDASRTATSRGYVKTVYGRHRHFNSFVSRKKWDYLRALKNFPEECPERAELLQKIKPVYGETAARKKWPNEGYYRDEVRKAFNSVIQGSSSDQTKLAGIQQCEAGFLPLSFVHDEINHSLENDAQQKICQEIQETCIPSLCPFDATPDISTHWL